MKTLKLLKKGLKCHERSLQQKRKGEKGKSSRALVLHIAMYFLYIKSFVLYAYTFASQIWNLVAKSKSTWIFFCQSPNSSAVQKIFEYKHSVLSLLR